MASKIKDNIFSISTLGWCGALLLVSFLPGSTVKLYHLFDGEDKIIHFILYAVLTFLILKAIYQENFLRVPIEKALLATALIVLPIALGTEIIQHFVPGRSMSLSDFIANFCGQSSVMVTSRILGVTRIKK